MSRLPPRTRAQPPTPRRRGAGAARGWWGSRFLESFLFEVPARDPAMFLSGALLLAAAGLAAAWLPARAAARLDPAIALRQE